MPNSIVYVLLQKPAALSMADWATSLTALRQAINKRFDAPQPIQRLHPRLSLDQTQLLIHGDFDDYDVTVNGAAAVVQAALAPKYTLVQCKTALTNNVTVLTWAQATAYLLANYPAWEIPEP